jgi:hypothetical protein
LLLRQPIGELHADCRVFEVRVDLGAVAGRQDRDFIDARQSCDLPQCLRNLLRPETHPFADRDRGGGMADSETEERHGYDQAVVWRILGEFPRYNKLLPR